MKFISWFIVLINITVSPLNCKTSNKLFQGDTVSAISPEVEVKAERIVSDQRLLVFARSNIDLNKSLIFASAPLENILSSTSGVFIRNYGGDCGLKTISLRGGNSQQTLLTIEGIRLNSTQNSSFDLSLLPSDFIESIEVIHGGASAVYGSSAMTGAVNFSMFSSNVKSAKLAISSGSYNDYSAIVSGNYANDQCRYSIKASYKHSDGSFPIEINDHGANKTINRTNADFSSSAVAVGYKTYDSTNQLRAFMMICKAERGSPGAVIQDAIEESNARLNEEYLLFGVGYSNIFENRSNINFSSSVKLKEDKYLYFQSINSTNSSNDYFNKEFTLNTQYNNKFGLFDCSIALEANLATLNSNYLQTIEGSFVERASYSAASSLSYSNAISADWLIATTASIRLDFFGGEQGSISPMLGLSLISRNLPISFRAMWSRSFRQPSFNEMYYFDYGNTSLLPETSHSFNIGFTWKTIEGKNNLELNCDAFATFSYNQIVSKPINQFLWTAANKDNVFSRGVEAGIKSEFFLKLISIDISYTYQLVTDESNNSPTKGKIIVYMPQELLFTQIFTQFSNFTIGLSLYHSSHVFSLEDNSNSSIIPAYTSFHFIASYKMKVMGIALNLKLDLNNIFDVRYSIIKNYPIQPRTVHVRLGLEV